jgi:hypothetical protein
MFIVVSWACGNISDSSVTREIETWIGRMNWKELTLFGQWRMLVSAWFVYKCKKRLRLVYVNSELLYYSRTECEITRLPYLTDMDQNETWEICIGINATRSTRSFRVTCHPRRCVMMSAEAFEMKNTCLTLYLHFVACILSCPHAEKIIPKLL